MIFANLRVGVHDVFKSNRDVVGNVFGRGPIFQFQKHGGAVGIFVTFTKVLKAGPKLGQTGFGDCLASEAVDQIMVQMSEIV